MVLGINAAVQEGGFLRVAVCPEWAETACACPRDAAGRLTVPHRVLQFSTPTEADLDGESLASWQERHAIEALRTVQAEQAQAPTALPSLKGLTL